MGTVDFQHLEENFFLTLNELDKTVLTIPAFDLLKVENMNHLIDTYGTLIKAKERSAAAAFLLAGTPGYAVRCSTCCIKATCCCWIYHYLIYPYNYM